MPPAYVLERLYARYYSLLPGLLTTPSARQVDLAWRRQLETAAPGVWVTVKEYPAGKRSTADVAASDIRLGKLRWARELHPLKVRVVKDVVDGQERFVVQAAKAAEDAG